MDIIRSTGILKPFTKQDQETATCELNQDREAFISMQEQAERKKRMMENYEAAARHHIAAARYFRDGDADSAFRCMLKARQQKLQGNRLQQQIENYRNSNLNT